MGKHNEIGEKGEEHAVQYLTKKGYNIIEINWRYKHKEIDIISRQNNKIIFIEVKTRTTTIFERPQDAVTIKKMKNLVIAANAYLLMKGVAIESRFDVITVQAGDKYKILEHIEGAFSPNDLL